MRDEIFDRDYQAGRDALHDGIDRLLDKTMQTFRVVEKVQFDAPWRRVTTPRPRRHGVA